MNYRISIVVASDYEPVRQKSWHHELALMTALAAQDIEEAFEVILVECHEFSAQQVPAELYREIPHLKIHFHDAVRSASRKDFGVGIATGELVAVLEADCVPSSNWLRILMDAVSSGKYSAASGRTLYGNATCYQRIMSLLHRSWDDLGHSGETQHISNNGAIYRRALLEGFPYPDAVTPFLSAAMRNARIRQAGHRFWFAREAIMWHAIGGLGFIWDYQRNKGHQSMGSRTRHNPLLIPLRLGQKIARDLRNTLRLGRRYLRWYDWPCLPVFLLLEIPPFLVGAMDAVRGVTVIPGTAYR